MRCDPLAALHRVGLDASECFIEPVSHNRWLTGGIWRVSTPDGTTILKCLSAGRDLGETVWDAHWTAGSEASQHWNYSAREGLAYLHRLPHLFRVGGIVAPEVLAVAQGDTDFVLLLEFVEGVPAERWAISDYAAASARLGRAQGSFLTGPPPPQFEWLSRGFLRDYSCEKPADWSLLYDDAAWAQPLVRRNFPPELRRAATWLHESRHRLYAVAEGLPRALCHLDFWTKNLIRRPDGTVALLDWAFVGDGAIGEDIGNLVPDAAFDHFVRADQLPVLEAAVLGAYVDGLHDAGWNGDSRLVQLGMWASAVKYDWLTPMMLASASATRQLRYGGTEEIDADYRFGERGLALLYNADTARRAASLADTMGVHA